LRQASLEGRGRGRPRRQARAVARRVGAQESPADREVIAMGTLSHRIRIGSRAVLLRLRLASMLARRSLPELLADLTPARPPRAPDPLPIALEALTQSEAVIERLRVVPDTCLYRSLARYA